MCLLKMRIVKNKLPRKRKKAFIKAKIRTDYLAIRILNEIMFEEKAEPCRFPKLKRNLRNPKGYDIIGYW